MNRLARVLSSIGAGVFGFIVGALFLMPAGCNDVGGVPSWERCTSAFGLAAFSVEDLGLESTLDILIPVVAGLLVALATWALIGVGGPPPDGG